MLNQRIPFSPIPADSAPLSSTRPPPPSPAASRRVSMISAAPRQISKPGRGIRLTRIPSPELIPASFPSTAKVQTVSTLLDAILHDPVSYKLLLGAKGEAVQMTVDLLQKTLSVQEISGSLRRSIIRAMIHLCTASETFPQQLVLEGVVHDGLHPVTEGAFGQIWKGHYENRCVCIKVAKVTQKSDNDRLLKELAREAIIWNSLAHPNLLPFYGLHRWDDKHRRVCLVSPWQENGDVSEYLSLNKDAPRIPLIFNVLDGLQYLHDNKIVHEDLKPANILVSSMGIARLADFGLASLVEATVLRWSSLPTTTRVGGTIRYQAPELMREREDGQSGTPQPTSASDIYSLASVMYEILTGKIPFYQCLRQSALIFKVASGEIPERPSDDELKSSELSTEIWTLMEACWRLKSEERPKIAEVLLKLQEIPPTKLTSSRIHLDAEKRKACPAPVFPELAPNKPTSDQPSFSSDEVKLLKSYNASHISEVYYEAEGAGIIEPSEGESEARKEEEELSPGVYRALYAFEPESMAEMRLVEDQVVQVVGRGREVGWAVVIVPEGEENGVEVAPGIRHALVPESYLEAVESSELASNKSTSGKSTFSSDEVKLNTSNVSDVYYDAEDVEITEPGESESEAWEDEEEELFPGVYRALFAFEPESMAEMRLVEDQVVQVVGRGGGVGWVIVVVPEGVEGGVEVAPGIRHALVPESYLEAVDLD